MHEENAAKAISQSPQKKQGKHAIVELKNGKVIFKQKPMSLEKLSETLQEIVKFREVIEQRIEKQEPPLQSIPDEHLPLIAKLGHDSDKTLPALVKHVQQELIPPQEDDEDSRLTSPNSILPQRAVEQAIKSVLHRKNYGLEGPNGSKTPAVVCAWRWEVKENYMDWLPKSVREKVEARLLERVQAKEYLRQIFEALTQAERNAILDPKGTNRAAAKDASNTLVELLQDTKSDNEKTSTPVKSRKPHEDENERNEAQDTAGRPKKSKDPEKVAKEKNRQEKKAVKAEREKKAKDAENKSRTLMASFFAKTRLPVASSSKVGESSAASSHIQNDFERTFKPFVLKKGSVLAPPNWFRAPRKRKGKETTGTDDSSIIVIDSDQETGKDDVVMLDAQQSPINVSKMTSQERLSNILTSLHPPLDSSRLPRPRRTGTETKFKTYNPHSVLDLVTKLSEAEVAGEDNEVRVLLNQLQDRDVYPAKVFIYHEDARPGYFGTWTRSSKSIGPRRPFAKDVVEFDYGYDSGAEWEEEPMGDADDVLDDDEEDGGSDSADSDMDSWLVDDDEEPEMLYHDVRDLSPPMLPGFPDMPPPPPPKRKAPEPDKKAKRRKVVVPLLPFTKGPCWETRIGDCEYEPFNQYRIQMFNDTPFPVDPFTFVSTCVEDYKASLKASAPTALLTTAPNGPFAGPNVPDTVATSSSGAMKKLAAPLKNPFPDTHLPFLLTKISELQLASFVLLVETIYQELKAHKVKKIAIEAKIREVGEKCKEKKVWIVKPTLKM